MRRTDRLRRQPHSGRMCLVNMQGKITSARTDEGARCTAGVPWRRRTDWAPRESESAPATGDRLRNKADGVTARDQSPPTERRRGARALAEAYRPIGQTNLASPCLGAQCAAARLISNVTEQGPFRVHETRLARQDCQKPESYFEPEGLLGSGESQNPLLVLGILLDHMPDLRGCGTPRSKPARQQQETRHEKRRVDGRPN